VSQVKVRRSKRSRYEIIHDVLDQCQTPSRKTWVMYKANLSYDLVGKYLDDLKAKGYIETTDGLYHVTEKGKELLEILRAWKQKKTELDEITKKVQAYFPEVGARKNGKKAKSNNENNENGDNTS
jgi:predicted transcriptional regulator